jgi:hypothetical protein
MQMAAVIVEALLHTSGKLFHSSLEHSKWNAQIYQVMASKKGLKSAWFVDVNLSFQVAP